jgi:phage tail tape-measure protein
MKSSNIIVYASATSLIMLFAGCSTWGSMDSSEKGTAVGATGGAVVGAAVGGPVGAAVGAGVGGYAGHYEGPVVASDTKSTSGGASGNESGVVRSAQEALNNKGYNVGAVDGVWGPNTESAVRQFQQAQGLQQSGRLDQQTLSALGISRQSAQ